MNASAQDFFGVLKQAVMFSPAVADWKCRQLQTFRAMRKNAGAQIRDANFGATICDKDKNFFWSRAWHLKKYNPNNIVFDYPALVISERDFTVDRPFENVAQRFYNYQLAIVDRYDQACGQSGKCQGCAGRTIEEIHADTEAMIFSVLRFISSVKYAALSNDEVGIYHIGYLDALVSSGEITGYTLGKDFGGIVASSNQNLTAYRVGIESEQIYGTAVNLRLPVKICIEEEYEFETLPDFASLAHEAGCTNCG